MVPASNLRQWPSFNAISAKALASHETARLPRSYWDWAPMLAANKTGYFPYTPATNLLNGLHEALEMLIEEGLDERLSPDTTAMPRRRAGPCRRGGSRSFARTRRSIRAP